MDPALIRIIRTPRPHFPVMSPGPDPSRRLLNAATNMTGAVLGLGLGGFFLDRRFESGPYLLGIGLLMGVIVGLYGIWKVMFPPGRDP